MRIVDGARLMRTSFDLVRHDRGLLWFPAASTCCFLLTAAFWLYEGTWLYSVHGPLVLFVPLLVLALYSVTFVGIFFSVALAGAASAVLDGRGASFGEGLEIAWSRLDSVAGWAAYALSVSLALSFVQRMSRWGGTAAQIAWSFATFFVVPVIAFEGLAAGDARRRSFELARLNWRAESGGLGALHAAMFVPALVFFVAYKALAGGDVHSPAARGLLGLVVAASLVVAIVAQVVRQVFAVWLYRTATS